MRRTLRGLDWLIARRINVFDVEGATRIRLGMFPTSAQEVAEETARAHTEATNHATITERELRILGIPVFHTESGCVAYFVVIDANGRPGIREIRV